jgi:hypothetical protein
MRRRNNRGYAANDINAATLGVNLYQAVPNGLQMTITNKYNIGGGTNSVSHFNDNTLAFSDDVTMLRGRHQIVFGGEWIQNQLNISNQFQSNGNFTFDGRYSLNGPNGGGAGGDPNLDLLMGAMSAFQQSKQQQNALRAPIPSLYIQDTFHANKQLTLVAGLRWAPEFLPVDYFNRGTTFSMSAFLANQVSTVFPTAPAGTFFYGDPGVPRQFTKNSPWQFSPNFGLSLDPFGDGKTVLRGGVELAYDMVNFFTGQRTQQNPPFATNISQAQTSTSGPMSFSSPGQSAESHRILSHCHSNQPRLRHNSLLNPSTSCCLRSSIRPTPFNGRAAFSGNLRATGSSRPSTSVATQSMLPWEPPSVRPPSSREYGVQVALVVQAS